jgi:hypothetical protein
MEMNPNPLEPWQPQERRPRARDPIWAPAVISPRQPLSPPVPPARPATRSDLWLVGILLVNLIGLGLIAWRKLPSNQLPLIASSLGCLALGLCTGITIARFHHVIIRCFFVILGLAFAGAAVLFVPSAELQKINAEWKIIPGMNLWTAFQETNRQAALLEALPAGDAEGFEEGRQLREAIGKQFPFFEPQLRQPQDAWIARSVPGWERSLAELPPGDVGGFVSLRKAYQPFWSSQLEIAEARWFERTYRDLRPGDFEMARRLRELVNASLADSARSWEREWADRTVDAALSDMRPLLQTDPYQVSARLRKIAQNLEVLDRHTAVQEKVLAERRKAFLAVLEAIQRQARMLISNDRYQGLTDLAQEFKKNMEKEATIVGLSKECADFCESCAFLAELARMAGHRDSK